jgi:IS1 family transposase
MTGRLVDPLKLLGLSVVVPIECGSSACSYVVPVLEESNTVDISDSATSFYQFSHHNEPPNILVAGQRHRPLGLLSGLHVEAAERITPIAIGRKRWQVSLSHNNSQIAFHDVGRRATHVDDRIFDVPIRYFLSNARYRNENSGRQNYYPHFEPWPELQGNVFLHGSGSFGSLSSLLRNSHESENDRPRCSPVGPSEKAVEAEYIPTWAVPAGVLYVFLGMLFIRISGGSRFVRLCGFLCGLIGGVLVLTGYDERQPKNHDECSQIFQHIREIVPRKYLTGNSYWGTVIHMANILNADKQIAVIGALAEGSSIRSIERITGVHRDTIMRLGVKVGEGCAKMLDTAMRDLPCNRLEMDEIWGFVGKKDRNVREGEDGVGSVWTFCAIDAETKLVPAFKCGNRDAATAKAFVQDVANRMAYRVQISTDGLTAYVPAMEAAFGGNVDYAQIIKTYGNEEVSNNRRYSAPEFVSSEKKVVVGNPDPRLISTSYIERLNATTRLHMRRLTRLTLAFSKKRENFEAAVALHFAYYNFVKRHGTLRCTPAMAAGVTGTFWGVGDLLEATA